MAGISRVCTGSSNNPDTFWYTHFPPLMRRTISLRITWDVVALSLHRGASAPLLADEDDEQDPDRWCSHAPGFPRSLANRQSMDLERARCPWAMCLSRLRCARPPLLPPFPPSQKPERSRRPCRAMTPLRLLHPGKLVASSSQDFALQSDGTVRCPAHQALVVHEHRREADGSLRVVYAASIRSCRPCPDAVTNANGRGAKRRNRGR